MSAPVDALVAAVDIQVIEYSNAATLAFLVWELCITLADEVDFVWSNTRSLWAKAAHLTLRYYTLVFMIFAEITWSADVCQVLRLCGAPYCDRWYAFQAISLQIVVALQQFLMASRVYALYGRSRRMYWSLFIAFAIEHIAMSTFTILTAHDVPVIGLCVPIRVSLLGIGIGLPPLIYDALLLLLTVRACIHAAPKTWRRTPLLALLYRDGVAAFLAVFGMFIIQAVFFLALRGPLASAAWSWQFAACSSTGGRVVLRMHQEARSLSRTSLDSLRHPNAQSEVFALTTIAPELDCGLEEW